jgi:hypothetical protein
MLERINQELERSKLLSATLPLVTRMFFTGPSYAILQRFAYGFLQTPLATGALAFG